MQSRGLEAFGFANGVDVHRNTASRNILLARAALCECVVATSKCIYRRSHALFCWHRGDTEDGMCEVSRRANEVRVDVVGDVECIKKFKYLLEMLFAFGGQVGDGLWC